MKYLVATLILFPALALAQSQDCTLKYLGVNTGGEEVGEPNTVVDGEPWMGLSERENESYASTNTFKLYSLDLPRSILAGIPAYVVNVFEITCVTP
tara:strand:+ start:242 stop:529 length:288 start_codon:yes stop_codon:yes gene_type:complete